MTGAVLTVALFTTGVLGVAADRAAQAGTLAGAHRAVELRPDVVRYRLLVAALARRDGTLRGVDEAIDSALAALDISPHDPVAQQAAAAALSHRAMITGDTDDIARALDRWAALVAADRLCADCQLGLGQAAALAGDADLALQAWTQAAALARPGDTRAADALTRLDEARS